MTYLYVNEYFSLERNIEDFIKDGLIITATTSGILFCAENNKRKIIKSISRCHGYHETCWWNMWRCISKTLCNL